MDYFNHFADSGKISNFPKRFFRHDCHNCIIHVHWNALRKKMQLWKQFCLFLSFSVKGRPFLDLCHNFRTWLSKLFPTCPLAHFEKNYFSFEQKLFVILSGSDIERILSCSEWNSFGFCLFFFGRIVETAFFLSWGTVWGDVFFSWKENYVF